jgi:acyl dehydratase
VTLLYLDDLHVGQVFEGGSITVTETEGKAFAAAFDPQPFHLDEEAGKASLFGGLALSGWHTAALTMRLQVEILPFAGGLIGAGVEIAWPRPTKPGDTLTLRSEVMAITPSKSRPERGMVTVRSETLNQRGEVAQTLTAKLVVPRRPETP